MREQLHPGLPVTANTGSSLQSIVNYLLRHPLADTLREADSSVINEISADLVLRADRNKITSLIQDLLETVIRNARKGRIHIKADRFRDIVILEIQDRSNYNGYALENSIRWMEPQARMVGGYISLKGIQQLDSTISFSFPNNACSFAYDC